MMRILLAIALLACAAAYSLVYSPGSVQAVGAPSENFTAPESPLSDPHKETIPSVPYAHEGPTALSGGPMPGFSIEFNGGEQHVVTGREGWSLLIDVNVPGRLYIFEYYPSGGTLPGRWLAYKWELPQAGLWRLGPFIPGADEMEGQHTCRAWFFGQEQWAAQVPRDNPPGWTYVRAPPAATPPATPPPVKQETWLDKLNSFIAQPAVLVIAPATLLLLAVIAWYVVSRNGRRQPLPETGEEIPAGIEFDEPGQQPFQSGTAPSRAVLMLPNGMEITVAGPECAIGRADLARAFGLDDLGLISRKHFRITRDGSDYYIADSESDNGTCVNGEEIGTESPRLLSSGDTITLAGSVTLKVRIL